MDGSFDDSAAVEPIVVRKYKNRRIYDTRRRCYVTLGDLRRMVLQRTPFVVEDAETGEDVTEQTLLQIVVGEEQCERPLMPVGFLGDVIRFYGDISMSMLRVYLDTSMHAFVINQKQIRRLLASLQSGVFDSPLYGLQGARASRNGSANGEQHSVLGAASELAIAVLESNIRDLEGQLRQGDAKRSRRAAPRAGAIDR